MRCIRDAAYDNDVNIGVDGLKRDSKFLYGQAKWVKAGSFLKVLADSLPSFVKRPPKDESLEAIRDFFEEIYNGTPDDTVVDSNLNTYGSQVFDLLDPCELSGELVLDIGSGSGSLYSAMMENNAVPFMYVGIDLSHPDLQISPTAKILNASAYDPVVDDFEPTHIVASNSLCYIKDLEKVPSLARSRTAKKLTIIEPIPGIFWNRHFDGILLYYRSPDQLSAQLHKLDWHQCAIKVFYLLKLGPIKVWPLCYVATYGR